jgi:protein-S-isoprenylcysteine O-methyltransferase Ste14
MDATSAALIRRALPRQVLFVLFLAVLLFAPAGTFDYWQAWLFLAVFVALTVAIGVYFLRSDPALVERRMKVGPKAEQEPTQKIIVSLMMAGFLLIIFLPGLDHRWHLSKVPAWLSMVAELGIAGSFVIFLIVMKQNSYAASTIVVETGQPVISTGLYGMVRHPMYAGALLMTLCTPLALGSYWSLLALILLLPAFAWRIVDEERFLKQNLAGYADYCRRTRYRLILGIW